MSISKYKIYHINTMLITMLKFTYPNKNLFSMNAVPYFVLRYITMQSTTLREVVHNSVHVHESKDSFALAR